METKPSESQSPNWMRVAVIGAGTIGSGWAAHFLRAGLEVTVWDPAEVARREVADRVRELWPTLTELGLSPAASVDRLVVVDSLRAAVCDAEFVQECGPEDLEAKVKLFGEITAMAPVETVVASSTSGILMSDIQVEAVGPERTVIGHPFTPPYLIPLVEVVGGRLTSEVALAQATAFYEATGKTVVCLDNEVPGFIGNRLQEALWREVLYMVAAGEATLEQIDAAMVHGPGLRWALYGPSLALHLAGGPKGAAHALAAFGGEQPWTRLAQPPITAELTRAVIDGCEGLAAGRGYEQLTAERDRALLTLLRERAVLVARSRTQITKRSE